MIRKYPDPILTKKCIPVEKEDIYWIKPLTKTIEKILILNNGVGISAPQLGYDRRFFWIFLNGKLKLYLNPAINSRHSYRKKQMEGCLSLPDIYLPVRRYYSITVEYYDENWNKVSEKLTDMKSRIFQHELDHLDGILIIDRTEKKYLRNNYPQFSGTKNKKSK